MPRELSTKPAAARNRLRKSTKAVARDLELVYEKPVSQWDFEELQRGRPRGPDGTFSTGARPGWLTDTILTEAQKRLKRLTRDQLGQYAGAAIEVLNELMKDTREDENGRPITTSATKLSAATYILDQVIGKPTQHVEVEGNVKLDTLLAAVIVNPDGEEAHPVIEGTFEEVEDDDDDE